MRGMILLLDDMSAVEFLCMASGMACSFCIRVEEDWPAGGLYSGI